MDSKGSLKVNMFNTEVYFHWSILMMIFFRIISGGFSIFNIVLSTISILLIVGIHEFGHASFVFLFGYKVDFLFVHGLGGSCTHEEVNYSRENLFIALGGIVFQIIFALLLIGILSFFQRLFHVPYIIDFVVWQFFVKWNLSIAFFNLLPIPGFDGSQIFDLNAISEKHQMKKQLLREKRALAKKKSDNLKLKKKAMELNKAIMNTAKKASKKT